MADEHIDIETWFTQAGLATKPGNLGLVAQRPFC